MSRNAALSPSAPRRHSPWTHLRQISRSSTDKLLSEPSKSPDTASLASNSTIRDFQSSRRALERVYTVAINESLIRDEVLLNFDAVGGDTIQPGTLMSITPVKLDTERPDRLQASLYGSTRPSYQWASAAPADARANDDAARRYVFVAKDMPKDLKARIPNVEVYVTKQVADAFNLRKGTQVVLSPVDSSSPAVEASHVELSFRDMYLSRSDMWKLAVADLADRTVYRGQVIYFLGTIKATVTTVFVAGRKVQSAFFGRQTRPIFRSESARYMLFIQMAREMWEFDSDGSGEIMFYKVVNGFLPALFKKWAILQVKHLVSIVLFARVEYDAGLTTDLANTALHDHYYTGFQTSGNKRPYKDFYRVVVSEISNGEWTKILDQLKKEFNVFRRDINLHHREAMSNAMEIPEDSSVKGASISKIKAEPSTAMHGNFLEAINMASSIYASDYIDRDLLRTGISIVLISPGPGVFEVEYESLRRTTEALVGNGIGIDLICIPNSPLHSVPLFRYRNPHFIGSAQRSQSRPLRSRDSTPKQATPLIGSYSTICESLSPMKAADSSGRNEAAGPRSFADEWAFALPQWLHVSYWTGKSEEALAFHGATLSAVNHSLESNSQDEFAIRCRLYDLQMRSVLETNEIETPYLSSDPLFPVPMSKPHNESQSRNRKALDALFEPVYGFQKFVPEKLTKPGETSLWKQLQTFDESRSRLPSRRQPPALGGYRELEENTKKQLLEDTGLFGTSVGDNRLTSPPALLSSSVASSRAESEGIQSSSVSRRDSTASTSQPKYIPARAPKAMRHISLGHQGFRIAAPKAASAELKMEHVNAMQPTGAGIVKTPSSSSLSPMTPIKSSSRAVSRPLAVSVFPPSFDHKNTHLDEHIKSLRPNTPTMPIQIRAPPPSADPISALKSGPIMPYPVARSARRDDLEIKYSNVLREEDQKKLYTSKLRAGGVPELPSTLSPTTAMAPWLVVLNPSNPDASRVDDSVLFSRWHHVFPVPSEMKVMKWKSLSCPAAVPLTTENFPSQSQFNAEYQRQPYNVAQEIDDEVGEEQPSRAEFLQELVNARFAHGFQVIIGPSVAKAFDQKAIRIADIFSIDKSIGDGTCIFMGIGNTIHQLSCVNGTEVEVNIFVRKPTEPLQQLGHTHIPYKPAIRTIFDETYESVDIDIMTPKPERNWNYIDSYLAGHTDEMTENLRFWRARFVLIPMIPRTSSMPQMQNEDDAEEVRLEGIKKLAQAWQRHRYLSSWERHFQSVGTKKRDPNPLDIIYKTEDASVVIAAEMETLPLFENAEGVLRKGLVSNRERFSKSNFNVAALAEAIQQPIEVGGIRMQTRRWHFRLHYHCFIGSDMTTWLLDNFEDLESREEAVELGNTLMVYEDDRIREKDRELKDPKKERERGIFVHVEKRHNFRDGQYFYQIIHDYAKLHPPSWFNRRRDVSVPSTPALENLATYSPRPFQPTVPRPGSINDDSSQASGGTTPTVAPASTTSGRRPQVVLSKMMKYDIDHRKKSFRPERINLHYDRLHNPDNCFHIRLEWMNVTAKLIEDALKHWAVIASQHGLRLVEVPITEACRLNEVNAFRRPYRLKLAIPPPSQRPTTYYNPGSFSPQPQPDKHFYQKELLKKFDYVLDYEAATNFPSNVDVTYSWGKPDFTYSQYIHRSGAHLVQITDDGDFLLAANRLYTNRVAATQPIPSHARPESALSRPIATSNAHPNYRVHDPMPGASPLTRPVLFVPSGPRVAHPEASPVRSVSGAKPGCGAAIAFPIPEVLKEILAAFCTDEQTLKAFYKETLEKGVETPSVGPADLGVIPDAGIPSLGLPPGILSTGGSDQLTSPTPRVSTPSLATSLLFRRGSVQY
ncbi:putative vacuolar membrane-associated protein iml-1 [Rosellinia necatrix]|uniref:Vacuolar membrane-associated protein IML1 n=1 Tax=Rosellinia necatrix TaxID=77044 RepID=A0A1W2TAW9_ROSNE|nr:putative vacuolar membrane-associated protein iml-1 [Rosellinia necatrix]